MVYVLLLPRGECSGKGWRNCKLCSPIVDGIDSLPIKLTLGDRNLAAIAQAELDLDAAQAMLTQAQNGTAAAVVQAEISLSVACEQLARLRAQRVTYAADIVTARIGLAQAEDAVARAEIWAPLRSVASWYLWRLTDG